MNGAKAPEGDVPESDLGRGVETAAEDLAPRVRAVCADGDPLARRVVKDTLRAAGVTVVAEAATGLEAVDLAVHYVPDVVLVDANVPAPDGIETIRRIRRRRPEVRVIMLMPSDDEDLALAGLRAGAVGVLSKTLELDTLPRVVAAVAGGEAAVSRRLTRRLVRQFQDSREGMIGLRPVRSALTDREWEVLDLLCAGGTTDSIADELVLTVETVRSHVKGIFRKLGVSSRAEAVAEAARLRGEAGAGATLS